MAIRFPEYDDPLLETFTVCGWVTPAPAGDFPEWSDDVPAVEARYDSSHGPVYVRLLFGKRTSLNRLHVHIDTARARAFGDKPPEIAGDVGLVAAPLAQLQGVKVAATATARYVVPSAELPEVGIIPLLRQLSGPTMRLTGSTFEITKPGKAEISWRMRRDKDDGDAVEVSVEADAEVGYGDDYLTAPLEALTKLFRRFVLETSLTHSEVKSGRD